MLGAIEWLKMLRSLFCLLGVLILRLASQTVIATFVYIELQATFLEQSIEFYSQLLEHVRSIKVRFFT